MRGVGNPPGVPPADRFAGFNIVTRCCGRRLALAGRYTFLEADPEPWLDYGVGVPFRLIDRDDETVGLPILDEYRYEWLCPKCGRPCRLGVARLMARTNEQHSRTRPNEKSVEDWAI
jgi:hypothetical protein